MLILFTIFSGLSSVGNRKIKEEIMNDKMKEALTDVSLNYGEKAAELAIEFVFELINKAAEVSENKIDDAFMPTLNTLKPVALAMAEQIYKGDN